MFAVVNNSLASGDPRRVTTVQVKIIGTRYEPRTDIDWACKAGRGPEAEG